MAYVMFTSSIHVVVTSPSIRGKSVSMRWLEIEDFDLQMRLNALMWEF